ncbi:hypothetical protein [Propionispira arboris]|uniref:hypothetical protein n=1 Tax=Propionispira arboris TaxID=84035 RepID=UPI000B8A46D8|nr:hypothetical protein [Propionispira arboris]
MIDFSERIFLAKKEYTNLSGIKPSKIRVLFFAVLDSGCKDCPQRSGSILDAGMECFIIGSSGLLNLHEYLNIAYDIMMQGFRQSLATDK